MKNILKEYLTFSNREKRGVMGLLILLAAVTATPYILNCFQKETVTDFSAFEKEIHEMIADSVTIVQNINGRRKVMLSNSKLRLFIFDPNEVTALDWKQLGCSQKQIGTILKYRERGGHFNNKEDLKKIYGFSASDYERLSPFVVINRANNRPESARVLHSRFQDIPRRLNLDLNTADSARLTLLKGIGPSYAARIIKYRNRLGGFVSTSQLFEIYGMDSTLFNLVAPCVYVKDSLIRKININSAGIDEMRKHPYFSYKLAMLVVNYRKLHGPYKNIEAINAIVLVHGDIYSKLAPYITIEN
jgi:competence protein ComEA